MLSTILASCIALSTSYYSLPPDALPRLRALEGGWTGLAKPNTNGSADLGVFQINTTWLKTFRIYWQLDSDQAAYARLRDDDCYSASAAGAVLRYNLQLTGGDLDKAIGFYHTGPRGSAKEAARYIAKYHALSSR